MLDFMLDISVVHPRWIVVSNINILCCVVLILLFNFNRFGIYVIWCFLEELNDEYGNPIWKNRVESWKDKKNKKKKATKAEIKPEKDGQVPSEQQMEEKE
jgi:hypothetical protein